MRAATIVDLGPQPDESYNRYVVIDVYGNTETMTSSLEDAQYVARLKAKKGTSGWYGETVITAAEYEAKYGHPVID